MDNQIVDKITKLLAKANGNISEAEAQLFMAKAQELALRNDIEISSLKNLNSNENEIIKETLQFGKRLPTVSVYVTSILQNFFNVRVLTYGRRETNRTLYFIGNCADIETAKYVYTWLSETMVRCWKKYYETPGTQLSQKQSYLIGFYEGLSTKLTANKNRIVSEQSPETQSKYAVVVANKATLIENAIEKFFPKVKVKTATKTVPVETVSYYKGIIDGNNCEISKGGIGGKAVAQLGY